MSPRLWLWVERAQATLPLLAVASLAGFSWWLVQSSPHAGGPSAPAKASSAPDYELHSARVVRVDPQGRLEAVLDGQAMRHYPDTDLLQIDQVVLTARSAQGQGLRAVARQGDADQRTQVVTLRGGAQVVATPPAAAPASSPSSAEPGVAGHGLRGGPLRFAGEGLRVDALARTVTSELPVRISQDHSQIDAQSLRYTEHTGITELGGRVRGQYVAATRP